MSRRAALALLALISVATLTGPAWGQTTTGSVGCAALAQAAANGMTARIQADDTSITPPRSVTTMTCLTGFFNGTGLDVVANLLDPRRLILAVEGQICNAVQSTWDSLIGSVQCGLTLTGFNLGFGGLGGGLSCPKLSFGGGGPPIASLNLGLFTNGGGLYIPGSAALPTGYTAPSSTPGSL